MNRANCGLAGGLSAILVLLVGRNHARDVSSALLSGVPVLVGV